MPTDREVLWLAIPALGALIAEPLYVLGDTAIIGHLGTVPLAGLALAGLLLSEIFGFCTFLEYGTTARAARLVCLTAARLTEVAAGPVRGERSRDRSAVSAGVWW